MRYRVEQFGRHAKLSAGQFVLLCLMGVAGLTVTYANSNDAALKVQKILQSLSAVLPAESELPALLQTWEYTTGFTAIVRAKHAAVEDFDFPVGTKLEYALPSGAEKHKENDISRFIDFITYEIDITLYNSKLEAGNFLKSSMSSIEKEVISHGDGGYYAKQDGKFHVFDGPASNMKNLLLRFSSGPYFISISQFSEAAVLPAGQEALDRLLDDDVFALAEFIATKISQHTEVSQPYRLPQVPLCSDDVKEAYQQLLAAYERLTQLDGQGEGSDATVQEAYENYQFYKDCHTRLLQGRVNQTKT